MIRFILPLLFCLFTSASWAQVGPSTGGISNVPGQFTAGSLQLNGNAVIQGTGTGNSNPQSAELYWAGSVSGTCDNASQACPVFAFLASGGFQVSSTSGAAELMRVYANFGGAAHTSGVNLFDVTLNMNAATGNVTNKFYTAAFVNSVSSVNDGGGSGTERGSLFALNPQSVLRTAATFFQENSAQENDISIDAASSAKFEYGVKVALLSTNVTAASADSAAFAMGMQAGGAATLKCGLCSGQNASASPLISTADFIGHHGAGTAPSIANGINFSNFSFSGAAFVGPATTIIEATGAGAVQLGSVTNGTSLVITDCGAACTNKLTIQGGSGSPTISTNNSATGILIKSNTTGGISIAPGTDNNIAFRVRSADLATAYLTVDTSTPNIKINTAAGVLNIDGAGSWAANGAVATALTSIGPIGSHTTVQEWLAITHGATVRWLPAF